MKIDFFMYIIVTSCFFLVFLAGYKAGHNSGIEDGIEMAAIAYEKAGYRLDETGETFDGISREEKNNRG